jgi:proteasome-associated ATPase
MATKKFDVVINELVSTIAELMNERTQMSLASPIKEGVAIKVSEPVIPVGELVVIVNSETVQKIGITGFLDKAPTGRSYGKVSPLPAPRDEDGAPQWDDSPIKIGSFDEIEAVNPQYQRRATIVVGGNVLVCKFNPKLNRPYPGAVVLVNGETSMIEAVVDYGQPTISSTSTNVRRVIDESRVEIDANRVAYYFNMELTEGDEVIVDNSGTVVLKKLNTEKPAGVSTTPTDANRVEWNDVIGLSDAKTRIIESIIQPMKYKTLYQQYGMNKTPKGMVLAGPPGCGKTMVGRAIATAIADASGSAMIDSGFIYVKSTELLDSFVGESEKMVRGLFATAANHYEKSGWPGVIFIDEADAILGTRGRGSNYHSLVAPFLTEMDGFDTQTSFVILATNRLDVIDPAVTRNGRLDFKINVGRPEKDASGEILRSYFSKSHLKGTLDNIVDAALDKFWSDDSVVGTRRVGSSEVCIRARDTVNGAMLKSIVDEAITFAIRRDLKNQMMGLVGESGITVNDAIDAVVSVVSQTSTLAHDDVWDEVFS